jgi:hypothetical protein
MYKLNGLSTRINGKGELTSRQCGLYLGEEMARFIVSLKELMKIYEIA